MAVLEIVLGILMGLLAIGIIVLVLLQQSRRNGISGVISGGADTFLSKNKAKTSDALLRRWTTIGVVLFMILAIVCTAIATITK